MVRLLYKSADMEEHLSITLQPVEGFQQMKCQFGVVFHVKSNLTYKSVDMEEDLSITLQQL